MPAAAVPCLEDIRSTFGFFDAWQDKYAFLIDIGKALVPLPDAERTEHNLVRGCQSQVWLVPHFDGDKVHLAIDSDAHIVRGLIAIVLAAYDDRRPRQILDFDIEGLFDELDLIGHLSPTRGNGLRAMVAKIRRIALEHA
ncbi:MAG: SufE family protein [Gammaproteobacteria bacterium]|nr:SufE family protein [Gammaproteobacteria bacterium]